MSTERMEILKMVAEKVISVEEGERLLRALGEGEQRRKDGDGPRKPGFVGAMENLGETLGQIGPMVRSMVEETLASVGMDLGEEDDGDDREGGETLGQRFTVGPETKVIVRDDPRLGMGADLELLAADGTEGEVLDEGARVTRHGNRIVIRTARDSLRVRIPAGALLVKATTLGGDITVRGVDAPLLVRSAGGSLELSGVRREFKAKSAGGNIRVDLAPGWAGDSKVVSMGGTISLRLPAEASAHVTATTMGGGVKVDDDLGTPQRTRSLAKERAELTLGTGASQLDVKTMGGEVVLRRLHA